MKTIIKPFILLLSFYLVISCQPKADNSVTIAVKNTTGVALTDVLVKLKTDSIKNALDLSDVDKIVLKKGETAVPFQTIDKDNDGIADKILFMADMDANETNEYKLSVAGEKQNHDFKKRTQAEISIKEGGEWAWVTKNNGNEQFEYQGGTFKNVNSLEVPEQHTDHSFYIRYEGPGWESDLVGYRFYLDWRNATDIYGKIVDTMALQEVGLDGFDSYHEMQPWGMDILKVGSSLGIGSPGYWDGKTAQRIDKTDSLYCKIVENGILFSNIKTKYYGWKVGSYDVNIKSYISIHAGTRLTKVLLKADKEMDNLCTGIVKHENTEVLQPETSEGDWSYLATYGAQSLNNDNLGMAVFYKSSNLIEVTEDDHSQVVVLKPENNAVEYYFAAAWEKEKNGIKTMDEFKEYLEATVNELNNPVEVSLK